MESQPIVDSLQSVRDVEGTILSTISTSSSTTLTLHKFTFDALTCDVSEERIAGVDAVTVVSEFVCFVHTVSMAENRWKVKR